MNKYIIKTIIISSFISNVVLGQINKSDIIRYNHEGKMLFQINEKEYQFDVRNLKYVRLDTISVYYNLQNTPYLT